MPPQSISLPRKGAKPSGIIKEVTPIQAPSFATGKQKLTGKLREGVLYEENFHQRMEKAYDYLYVAGPWFFFRSNTFPQGRICQPDGLLFDPLNRTILIFECKLKHTTDSWWQLRHLYLPVISWLFPPNIWTTSVCEVVKWYDPETVFPEPVYLLADPLLASPERFGVHIWNP